MTYFKFLNIDLDEKTIDRYVIPWIHDAGNPYYDWLFQDTKISQKFLRMCIKNPHSGLFIRRIRALIINEKIAGGYIAIPGYEVKKCRKSDAKTLISYIPKSSSEKKDEFFHRLSLSNNFFPPVREDENTAILGINRDFRGKGYGSILYKERFREGIDRKRVSKI